MIVETFGPLFWLPIFTGPIFILAGLVLFKFPPKKINSLYGYRTNAAMRSQEKWDFAQKYSAILMMKSGFVFTSLCIIGMLISINEMLELGVCLVLLIGLAVSVLLITEREIQRKFKNK